MRCALDAQQIAAASASQPAARSEPTLDFDTMEAGKPLAGFSSALTGEGGPVSWVVQEDATVPSGDKALAQTAADRTSYRFSVCIYDGFTGKGAELAVSFKPICHVVRANALENNIVLYKVENGKRSDLRPKGS